MEIELDAQGYTADGKWRLVPVEATDEMLRTALCVRWPASFKEFLRHPMNGPKTASDDEKLIQEIAKQIAAAIKAAPVYVPRSGKRPCK